MLTSFFYMFGKKRYSTLQCLKKMTTKKLVKLCHIRYDRGQKVKKSFACCANQEISH